MAYEQERRKIPEWGVGAFVWLIAVGSFATMFGIIFDFFPAKLMGVPTLGLLLVFPCVTKVYWI
jgi:hypothetical protein